MPILVRPATILCTAPLSNLDANHENVSLKNPASSIMPTHFKCSYFFSAFTYEVGGGGKIILRYGRYIYLGDKAYWCSGFILILFP